MSSENIRLSLDESSASEASFYENKDFSVFCPDFEDFESALNPPVLEFSPPFFGCGILFKNLQLPNYCKNDPNLYVFINKLILESDYVSKRLNEWIDLVFGVNQCVKNLPQLFFIKHDIKKVNENTKAFNFQTNISHLIASTICSISHSSVKINCITMKQNIQIKINVENGDIDYKINDRNNESVFVIPDKKGFVSLDFVPDSYHVNEYAVYGTTNKSAFIFYNNKTKKIDPILPHDTHIFVLEEETGSMRVCSKSNLLVYLDCKMIVRHSIQLEENPISINCSKNLLTGVLFSTSFVLFDCCGNVLFRILLPPKHNLNKVIFDGDVFGAFGNNSLAYFPFNINKSEIECRIFNFQNDICIQSCCIWLSNKSFYTFSAHGALNIIPFSAFSLFV